MYTCRSGLGDMKMSIPVPETCHLDAGQDRRGSSWLSNASVLASDEADLIDSQARRDV